MIVLHALHALQLIHELGLIHTGMSRYLTSHEVIFKYNRLDVKASDMLLLPGIEDDNKPIIKDEIRLQGKTYPILAAQPLLHTFRWDDLRKDAELRIFCLNDMGHGESLQSTIMLVVTGLTSL
jgi:hypothetical protein